MKTAEVTKTTALTGWALSASPRSQKAYSTIITSKSLTSRTLNAQLGLIFGQATTTTITTILTTFH